MSFNFATAFSRLAGSVVATLLLVGHCVGQTLELTQVASGLTRPIFATYAPGDTSRLFIAEQGGNIKILNLGTGAVSTFMTQAQLASANGFTNAGNEQGLLGMAFDPNYATNRRFYVNYTAPGPGSGGSTFVRSFVTQELNPNSVDGNNGAANILNFTQDFTNHNGGWLGFGPDNQLYIATGDGGSGNDPNNRAQDRNSFLGKMLRISPDTTAAGGYTPSAGNPFIGVPNTNPAVWAYGLRNPWRNSFDRLTGDMYIGDVGQNSREEISFQAAGTPGGVNFGWRQWEGMRATGLAGQPGTAPDTKPIFEYLQGGAFNEFSVTGGYVYRGPLTALQGHYFFGDYVGRTLRSFRFDGSPSSAFNGNNVDDLTNWTFIARNPAGVNIRGNWSSFAEDALGNLYAIDHNGSIYKFTAASIPEPAMGILFVASGLVMSLRRRRQ